MYRSTKPHIYMAMPYLSLFIVLFTTYLVFDLLKELHFIIISHKVNKFMEILLPAILIVVEFSRARDKLWKVWKNMSLKVHLVVTLFFSLIILRLFPVAWQNIWNIENENKDR
ncbi:hypothetical protein A2130_00025 [Candidatus Woesebacteria bacterium GWC2_33_12]|uniref:Uncharacterized protein n=1 Tax=Candidatus Woesebacteria bacterium GW2011_GWB1_33_22 TaxID=1618566 RepID=A0A0F9ZXN2_9BACT|nr:MAG: hypothetical protein UR29_C0019G0006 [Candidatus Woesebacteria bacterium GW2011_GWC2_33_12]KKP41413.1 MAG: hypothetical protein UR33_C0017G0006 [Candidatus Woesebacteria bacterium GW2011_GWA2_33_20]KKP43741.1 MAG: hypothetical protein UR35_C0017G0006 [Candidatus Woesebacteria bacterium GW2011_GWB1_33_22]KKP45162.1 MAG: hypothetical protein UR37_C0019G0006 [Microgenomates group bacterium GW2011_GWC1_33_28]KKP49222.1 MAG: hypothetical protein UR41_C0018G0006 [Candidatus Woesebacteria bact